MTVPGPTEINFPEVTVMAIRTFEATNMVAGQYVEFDDTVLSPTLNAALAAVIMNPDKLARFVGCKGSSADRATADMSFDYTAGGKTVSHAPGTVSVGDPIDVGQATDASAKGKWEKAWKPATGASIADGRGKVMALEAGSPGDTIRVYVDAYKNSVGYKGIG